MRIFEESELPCAVGESPFRIKGVAYQQTWSACDRRVGDRAAVLNAIPSARGRHFLQQPFLPGSWYDVLPMVWLDAASAKVRELPPAAALRQDSIEHARETLRGVYRSLLQVLSNATVASVLPRIINTYYDFCETKVRRTDRTMFHVVVGGMPSLLKDWYMISGGAFIEEALVLAGAKEPSVVWQPTKPTGMRERFALSELSSVITWHA